MNKPFINSRKTRAASACAYLLRLCFYFLIVQVSIDATWAQNKPKKKKAKLPPENLSGNRLKNARYNFKFSKLQGFSEGDPKKESKSGRLGATEANVSGASLSSPTSLQFGPDGRLYVSQQNGLIKAFTIVRNAANFYSVTATETIDLVQKIPNHNDDGSLATSVVTRQVTGIVVAGTAANPVLYVGSSDSRIGGPSGDKNLDTNSGIISRLIKSNGVWDKVDLVRGLPRSEENHANNGLQLDVQTNKLFVAVGGLTNAGGPSNNFAFICEYALSAAILSIDLTAIDAMTLKGSGNTKYKYDLPTLNDPTRAGNPDANDPFGGNDGLNQAKIVAGGPVQVFASGFRNAYDFLITKSRKMYTIDNGANGGWGGYPANEGPQGTATNNYVSGEPGAVNNLDNFHYLGNLSTYTPGSFYGGHPNPIRANPTGAGLYTYGTSGVWRTSTTSTNPLPADWPPVPSGMARPIEGDYQSPGVADNSLLTFGASTNGLAEYTASGFPALKGSLLAASYDGKIYKITLTTTGDGVTNPKGSNRLNTDLPFASGFGTSPLDITTRGDNESFPGTVWVACYNSNSIAVFEPAAVVCSGTYSTSLDDDNDSYSNADEIDNGTNPCSAADKPDDFDADRLSDLNDTDDDNDAIGDNTDKFAIDAQNGNTTYLPIQYELFNNNPGTGFFGLGFKGLMTNGKSDNDYLELWDDQNLIAGGAVGAFTVVGTSPGDALGTLNNQENAFQFGINTTTSTGPFTVQSRLLGAFFNNQTPINDQSEGIYIGTGDQNNYLKIVLNANNGVGGIEVVYENAGIANRSQFTLPGGLPTNSLDLYLSVNPTTGAVQPKYSKDGGQVLNLGLPVQVSGTLLTAIQGAPALAVGVISTSRNATPFTAHWDYIRVTTDPGTNRPPELAAIGSKTVVEGQLLSFSASATDPDGNGLTYSLVNAPAGAAINAASGAFSWTPTTAQGPAAYTFTVKVTDNGTPALSDEEQITVNVTEGPVSLYRINSGNGAFLASNNRQFQQDAYFTGTRTYSISGKDILNTTDDVLYYTERSETSFAYTIPVINGTYDVVLHFAEIYWGVSGTEGAGKRLFNVDIEGVRKLTEYDVTAAAGGALKAKQETFRVSVSDGTLNIVFAKGTIDLPTVAAIEVLPASQPTGQQVVSFSLINADTEQVIQTLTSNTTLNLATLPTRNLNIRANTTPATVGSVKFALSGTQTQASTETTPPYALFGDSNGNYTSWTPAVGSYTLTATPYSASGGGGTAGTALTINFTVSNLATTARAVEESRVAGATTGLEAILFPNPVAGTLTVTLDRPEAATTSTRVTSSTGRVFLANKHKVLSERSLELDVSSLPPGIYFLSLNNKVAAKNLKFSKE